MFYIQVRTNVGLLPLDELMKHCNEVLGRPPFSSPLDSADLAKLREHRSRNERSSDTYNVDGYWQWRTLSSSLVARLAGQPEIADNDPYQHDKLRQALKAILIKFPETRFQIVYHTVLMPGERLIEDWG